MRILVCLDGEPHTRGAVERAIELAVSESAELVGLHVIDDWLRQFSSEIYAQGRQEYLDWVDQCLQEKAAGVREAFVAQCCASNIETGFVLRDGDPLAEVVAVVAELNPDLVLTGAKTLTAWDRFRSRNLPATLQRRLREHTPIESVTDRSAGHGTTDRRRRAYGLHEHR